MRSGPFVAAVFFLAPCGSLVAQGEAPSPRLGTSLRVTVPCELLGRPAARGEPTGCRLEGRLVLWQTDTITLAVAEAPTRYGLNAIIRVEASRGRRSHWLVGAGAGFVVGAGTTFILLNRGGSTAHCDQSANQDAISPGGCIGLTALGGLAGAGLGAIVGALIRTERWEDVPLERLRVSLMPQAGNPLGLVVTVAF